MTCDHGGVGGECYWWIAATAAAAAAMTRAARCTGVVVLPGEPQDDSSKCAVEPHHSHFVLAPSNDWGGETTTLFTLAKALTSSWLSAVRTSPRAPPMAAVLANGGFISKQEVWRLWGGGGVLLLAHVCACVSVLEVPPVRASHMPDRRGVEPRVQLRHAIVDIGMPVVVIVGSGRLADDVAAHLQARDKLVVVPQSAVANGKHDRTAKDKALQQQVDGVEDEALRAILAADLQAMLRHPRRAHGLLLRYAIADPPSGLRAMLLRCLMPQQ